MNHQFKAKLQTILKQDKDSLSYYKTKNASQGSNTFGFCKEYNVTDISKKIK